MARGHRFTTMSNDAIIPIQHSAINIPELLEIQSSEGAYQKRMCAKLERLTACRYSLAGRIPRGPMSPRIWKTSE